MKDRGCRSDNTLLMIPGPIEFEPAVLAALGAIESALRKGATERQRFEPGAGCGLSSLARTQAMAAAETAGVEAGS